MVIFFLVYTLLSTVLCKRVLKKRIVIELKLSSFSLWQPSLIVGWLASFKQVDISANIELKAWNQKQDAGSGTNLLYLAPRAQKEF